MICITCGKEIVGDSSIFPCCGCLTGVPLTITQEKNTTQTDKVEAVKVVLSVVISIVGIILGIINLKDGRKKSGSVYLIVGIVITVIDIILGVIFLRLFLVMFLPFLLI